MQLAIVYSGKLSSIYCFHVIFFNHMSFQLFGKFVNVSSSVVIICVYIISSTLSVPIALNCFISTHHSNIFWIRYILSKYCHTVIIIIFTFIYKNYNLKYFAIEELSATESISNSRQYCSYSQYCHSWLTFFQSRMNTQRGREYPSFYYTTIPSFIFHSLQRFNLSFIKINFQEANQPHGRCHWKGINEKAFRLM